eukprot:Opistho-1_new@62713
MPIIPNLDVMLAKRKMRSNELAEKIGITTANLSILKTGKAKAVRFSTLEAICEVLECQPGDILEFVNEEKNKIMRKLLLIMGVGMLLVVIGALLKITHAGFGNYVLIAGLCLEAFALGSLVLQSLRKIK